MACINTWRCDLQDCCYGYSFEQVPLNFLCDVNINNYVDPDLGLDMTILWSGDPLVWSGYSATTPNGIYSGCFRITYAQAGAWVDGAFAPDPSFWFSGITAIRDSCASCTNLYPCPPPPGTNPCLQEDCYKCRYEDATSIDQCVPYIYSGCVELRDAKTHWEGRRMYDVSGWFQGGLSQTWRAIPYFSPAWPKNVNWQGFNPLPCPSNNGVQNSNEVWYDFGDDVPFGNEAFIDPLSFDHDFENRAAIAINNPTRPDRSPLLIDPPDSSVLETWWHIGSHTGNIDMTFQVMGDTGGRGGDLPPMRILVFWNDIMFCDSGFIGNITAGRNGTQPIITNQWITNNGDWSQYNVGCGYMEDIYEMAPGKFGTCGMNGRTKQCPYRKINSQLFRCYSFTPPSYSTSNPGNYALRSHDRRDFWGNVTFADGRTFGQFGAPGQIGVVNDYPRGSARSTNGRIKLRFNKNLPEPTYCKIFVVRGPLLELYNPMLAYSISFQEMICNGLS
jgi:hypothetical protein